MTNGPLHDTTIRAKIKLGAYQTMLMTLTPNSTVLAKRARPVEVEVTYISPTHYYGVEGGKLATLYRRDGWDYLEVKDHGSPFDTRLLVSQIIDDATFAADEAINWNAPEQVYNRDKTLHYADMVARFYCEPRELNAACLALFVTTFFNRVASLRKMENS